jgi:electron transport complex protein RnfB
MVDNVYKKLAERLDALPNRFGYPATEDGVELLILEKIFEPEEAELAVKLRLTRETPEQLAERIGGDADSLRSKLNSMAKKRLIGAQRGPGDTPTVYGLIPFAWGMSEYQSGGMDAEMAQLIEDHFQQSFPKVLAMKPQLHRVIPIGEAVRNDMEVHPFESATALLEKAQSWGVQDCICRKQKALIGDPCDHPKDVCMLFAPVPNHFDNNPVIRAQTKEEALANLKRAADAGLVHTVSNTQEGISYICNCCTCSCVILRGMAEMGIANVVVRSAFVNTVDADLCGACEDCVEHCQFDALELGDDNVMQVNRTRCVGCGVCVTNCPDDAMTLVRRPEEEIKAIPATPQDWMAERAATRGLDMSSVL